MAYQTVIKRARYKVPGYMPETMIELGKILLDSIQNRLDRAQDVYDNTAPPLTDQYRRQKQKRFGTSTRDLRLTGLTRRSMVVLRASTNQAVIGFTDPTGAFRARENNRKSRQWGVSPRNEQEFLQAANELVSRPVVIVQEPSWASFFSS